MYNTTTAESDGFVVNATTTTSTMIVLFNTIIESTIRRPSSQWSCVAKRGFILLKLYLLSRYRVNRESWESPSVVYSLRVCTCICVHTWLMVTSKNRSHLSPRRVWRAATTKTVMRKIIIKDYICNDRTFRGIHLCSWGCHRSAGDVSSPCGSAAYRDEEITSKWTVRVASIVKHENIHWVVSIMFFETSIRVQLYCRVSAGRNVFSFMPYSCVHTCIKLILSLGKFTNIFNSFGLEM